MCLPRAARLARPARADRSFYDFGDDLGVVMLPETQDGPNRLVPGERWCLCPAPCFQRSWPTSTRRWWLARCGVRNSHARSSRPRTPRSCLCETPRRLSGEAPAAVGHRPGSAVPVRGSRNAPPTPAWYPGCGSPCIDFRVASEEAQDPSGRMPIHEQYRQPGNRKSAPKQDPLECHWPRLGLRGRGRGAVVGSATLGLRR